MTPTVLRRLASLLCLLCLSAGTFSLPASARQSGQSAPQANAPAAPAPIQKDLPPVGVPTEQRITPGQVHRFKMELKAGLAFRAHLQRKGVVISMMIYDAKDQPLILADISNDLDGKIPLVFIPKETGTFQVSIESEGAPTEQKA